MKLSHLVLAVASSLLLNATSVAQATEMSVNGFASIAYTDSANDSGYAQVKDGDFKPDSLFGLQASFDIDSKLNALAQVVAHGQQDWELDLTMAYLGYTFDNGVQVRGGRLRLPMFFLSEYLQVGYAQPWARSPNEVYGMRPFQALTGADIQYEFEFDDSYFQLQGYAGSQSFSLENVEGELKDAFGMSAMWYDDNISFRLGYNIATANSIGLNSYDEDTSFMSAGVRYDDGKWLLIAEHTQTKISSDTATALYPENIAGYITAGYRINSLMPYVSASRITTDKVDVVKDKNGDAFAIPGLISQEAALDYVNYDVNSYSVGVRWDIQPGLSLKGDVTYVDYLGTSGGIVGNSEPDDYVYTIKVDTTF